MKRNKNVIKNILLAITIIIPFVFFTYGDLYITTVHGINFWDCLFAGDIRDFYKYNCSTHLKAGVFDGYYCALYDFLIYLVFAIWNLPLWIAGKTFCDNPLDTALGGIWAKSIVLFFLAICIYIIFRIFRMFDDDLGKNKFEFVFLILTSAVVFTYAILLGQYDIIVLSFVLMGIYCFIKEETIKAVIWFSIAIPVKSFALLCFVAIILYLEKNLIKDIGYIAMSLVPLVIMRKLVPMTCDSNGDAFYSYFFQNRLPLGVCGNVPIFVIAIVMFYICSYLMESKDDAKSKTYDIVYLAMVSYVIMAVTCVMLPYWSMYIIPFAFILIFLSNEKKMVNILFEIVFSCSIVISQLFRFPWMYSSAIANRNTLGKIYQHKSSDYVDPNGVFLKVLGEKSFSMYSGLIEPVFMGVFVASIILFCVYNNPRCRWKVPEKVVSELTKKNMKYLIYSVRLMFCMLLMAMLFVEFIK